MAQDMRTNNQSPTTNPTANQTGRGKPGVQTATAGNVSGREQSDRQRPIATARDTGLTQRPEILSNRSLSNDPFAVMQRMADDMDRLFANFGFPRMGMGLTPSSGLGLTSGLLRDNSIDGQSAWAPQIEVFRRDNNVVIHADLPGLKKEDINIEIDDGVLTLSGERQNEHVDNRDGYYRNERNYGQFVRTIPLPDGAEENACKASFDNGVLEVVIPVPKEQTKQARKIEIH
jgi:HSP20 family protein